MSATHEDDAQTWLVLGLAVGAIATVLLVMGVALSRGRALAPVSAPAAAASAAAVVGGVPEAAGIRVEQGVVKFYFATGSAELPAGAAEALAPVIEGVGAGKKAEILGYHDPTGDAAANAELALRRAQAVRDMLATLGVPAAQLVMQRPAPPAGSGASARSRRVEVRLVD